MKSKYFLSYILMLTLILIFIIGCNQRQEKQIEIEEKNQENYEVLNMKLTSSAFAHNGTIPSEFTCDGQNINSQLSISDVPANAKSLVLIVDDPDAVVGVWDHWVVFDMPPSTKQIAQNSQPDGVVGKNSGGRNSYQGPCPPSGTHRYFFKLYALDTKLDLPEGSSKDELEKEISGHVIEKTELIGLYKRK